MKTTIKAVIDTNILISGLLNDLGAPAKLITHWEHGLFEIALSDNIFDEYRRVFLEFTDRVEENKVVELLEALKEKSIWVEPSQRISICKDASDDKFIECAVASGTEYLVTKNIRHFPKIYKNVRALKISAFLSILESHYNLRQ